MTSNSLNTLWRCSDTNNKGQLLEDFFFKHDLCILNIKSQTFLHPDTGSYSSLDLSICSPDICVDFKWKGEDDFHGSDHFPVIITETEPFVQGFPKQWKLHKANCNLFQMRCEQSITPDAFLDCDCGDQHN